MTLRVGMCFSRPFEGDDPLGHIGKKLPVYLRLLKLCQRKDWETLVLTRRTYKGKGIFAGSWQFKNNKFLLRKKPVKIDLVYDRVAGMKFPPPAEPEMVVINQQDFKLVCYDKYLAYQKIGQFMPKTFWVGEKRNLASVLPQIKTSWVVLKPYNGLKGIGVFVGPKDKALTFDFFKKHPQYIAQNLSIPLEESLEW